MHTHTHTHDTKHSSAPAPCYQVATPKSPHDPIILSDDEQCPPADAADAALRFDAAKSEILDIVNLQTLIAAKDIASIEQAIRNIDAQMAVLKHMHSDNSLLDKVDRHLQEKHEVRRRTLEAQTLQNTWRRSISFAPAASPGDCDFGAPMRIPNHHYQTRSKSHGNLLETPLFKPDDDSILNERTSKKQKQAAAAAAAAAANSIAPGKTPPKMTTSKSTGFEIHKFQPNQMNTHHRRVYSSSCLSNNSGVVGHTETNKPIFRRYDGILVVITCSFCDRADFTSAQGIVNHTRLKHHKTYSSQPLAILFNQALLPDDRQDKDVLAKFAELGLDATKEYLPYNVAIPTMSAAPKMRSASAAKLTDHLSIDSSSGDGKTLPARKNRSTNYLKKLYKDDDLGDLVNMVEESRKDLQVILDQPSEPSDEEEIEVEIDDENKDEDYVSDGRPSNNSESSSEVDSDADEDDKSKQSALSNVECSPLSAVDGSDSEEHTAASTPAPGQHPSPKRNTIKALAPAVPMLTRHQLRKRSRSPIDNSPEESPVVPIKRRLRNADVSADLSTPRASEEPEADAENRRSRHHNLRLRSRLRNSPKHP